MDSDSRSQVVELRDYRPFPYSLLETHLEFFLDPKVTRVMARLHFEGDGQSDLELDGEELRLVSVSIDDQELAFGDLSYEDGRLVICADAVPAGRFVLQTEVEISPESNRALSGLYISGGMYCTQCEAQGFRRITYYPDRPDVLSEFYVTIHSDMPLRLSNGNPVKIKDNISTWHDPWPKPSYLFALVAGELEVVEDQFITASGLKVDLKIYVRKGDETRCGYAMDALKRSMRWDEEAYGREYDLNLFMIVAVDDFNMGAMENKGLNIFNSRLVLASPDTATDAQYAAIESVIAHEYFHNWTGDRITCRDWFQLSLKEGLTVYRDQQFSGDERSRPVQRIEDVKRLRAMQFPEDAGPLAHPVRPQSYAAIDNFYTATVYEKGAEVIGMMHTLVGAENYRKATDLYFERFDGQACTIEDWLSVFEDVTGRNFDQFKLWYAQAGTPTIRVSTSHDGEKFIVDLEQKTPPTPGQPKKKPMLVPLAYTIYSPNGDKLHQGVLELDEAQGAFGFDAPADAVLSINQGFSAPVYLEYDELDAPFLLRHDQDPFNRWEATQNLALDILTAKGKKAQFTGLLGEVIDDIQLDPAYRALLLSLPDVNDMVASLAQKGETADPVKIAKSRASLMKAVAKKNEAALKHVYDEMRQADQGSIDPHDAARRSLALAALSLLSTLDADCALAKTHFQTSLLMTDLNGALSILVREGQGEDALAQYYEKYKDERLVVDNWIGIQAAQTPAKEIFATLDHIASMDMFKNPNPNRFRALYGNFAMRNFAGFHAASGKGYQRLAEEIVDYDRQNPQTAARLVTAYQSYRNFDEKRQTHARAALESILASNELSKNTREMVSRLLS